MSKQWLNRGEGLRNRSYRPIKVKIVCGQHDDTSWSRETGMKFHISAWKPNGEYQSLDLSQAEADEVAPTLVACMSQQGREKLVNGLLGDLSDAKLLRALALDLKRRKPLRKNP
jgi:hypothetical protein